MTTPPAPPAPLSVPEGGGQARSDHELLQALAEGDPGAFGVLVERWRPKLVNFLVRRGADREGAEDCAQEAFVRIYGYRSSYRPQAPFSAFLFTVARNALLDWKRRRARRPEQPLGPEDLPDGRATDAGDAAGRLDLEAALEQLPEALHAVVALAGLRGLPYQVVGVLLGIPEGTVKSRMFYALRRLREVLGG